MNTSASAWLPAMLAGTLVLGACALGEGAGGKADAGAGADPAAGPAAVRVRAQGPATPETADASRQGEPRYIRYRADETGLQLAIDDGANTYLEFAGDVDPSLAINDQDGRALVWTRVGRVAAIAGLHQGVLLRRGERASFISPNPRWHGRIAMTLPARADFGEARARLENQALLQSAMERALVASSSREAAASPALAPAAPLQPGITRSTGTTLAPLAKANLSASASEQGLVRVFFASASRAIVAPDDGLATLLREAPQADEIRITGFTDAIGSKEANLRLARSRADAVAQILYRRGISGARIVVDAVAADEYIAGNDSDRGRAMNRRAEIVLVRDGRPMLIGSARR